MTANELGFKFATLVSKGHRYDFGTHRPYPICSQPEAASEVVSGIFVMLFVADKAMKIGDPHLNRSWEIRQLSDTAFSL